MSAPATRGQGDPDRGSALERLRQELDAELAQRLEDGLCGCPCGKPLPRRRRSTVRYLNDRHKDDAYRDRVRRLAEAQGVPVRQSLKTLDAATDTGNRRPDGPRGTRTRQTRRRDGVTVYLPTVELAEALAGLLDLEGTRKGRRAHELGRHAYLSAGMARAPTIVREYVEALEAAYAERLAGELEPARDAIGKALERRRRRR